MDHLEPQCSKSAVRKHAKGVIRLRNHLEIWRPGYWDFSESNNVCKVLAIGNAGLSCGFSVQNINEAILRYLNIAHSQNPELFRVVMVPDKPFALVKCCSPCWAKRLRNSLLGCSFTSSGGQTLPWFPLLINDFPESAVAFENVNTGLHDAPPGLDYIADFISQEEECRLFAFIDDNLSSADTSNKDILKNRTVLHYGRRFRYGTNDIDPAALAEQIPDILEPILERLCNEKFLPRRPDQITVNVYEPGQGIPLHVDTHSAFENGIVSLSLGGPVIMDFVRDDTALPVVLYPRSLLVMRDEARYAWRHGIVPRISDFITGTAQAWRRERRISFTFRCIRNLPCSCSYPEQCDTQISNKVGRSLEQNPCSMDLPIHNLEEKFVHEVYDQIAPHFSETRYKPWPRVSLFLESLKPGSLVLDVGCGNGKYLGVQKHLFEIGCDRSSGLIEICRSRRLECFISDALSIPFRSECCDGVICIAVIHHLSSRERRLEALRELIRVLVIGGRAIVYVWALEQKKGQKISTYLKAGKQSGTCVSEPRVSNGQLSIPIHTNRTEFLAQDILVPWHKKKSSHLCESKDEIVHRYYHVFREGELREYCASVKGVIIEEVYYDEGNWCVVLQKQG